MRVSTAVPNTSVLFSHVIHCSPFSEYARSSSSAGMFVDSLTYTVPPSTDMSFSLSDTRLMTYPATFLIVSSATAEPVNILYFTSLSASVSLGAISKVMTSPSCPSAHDGTDQSAPPVIRQSPELVTVTSALPPSSGTDTVFMERVMASEERGFSGSCFSSVQPDNMPNAAIAAAANIFLIPIIFVLSVLVILYCGRSNAVSSVLSFS